MLLSESLTEPRPLTVPEILVRTDARPTRAKKFQSGTKSWWNATPAPKASFLIWALTVPSDARALPKPKKPASAAKLAEYL